MLVAGLVAGGTAAAQSTQRFPDVPPDHPAFEAVDWAAEVGVTTGYTDGTFKPERPLSKGHAVVFMERYYDEILQAEESEDFTRGDMMVLLKAINDGTPSSQTEQAPTTQRFPDVPPDHPAFEAVDWAAEVGVTTGYTDGTFKPERPLSKGHAVVFMERYYDEILQAEESEDFTRGDMMVLLKAINDGTPSSQTEQAPISDCIDAQVRDYFFEIALGSEFGSADQVIRKWERDLAIKVHGDPTSQDRDTLDQIITELNDLIGSLRLKIVQSSSNVDIHFAAMSQFRSIEPNYVAGNTGFFWMWWRHSGSLVKARILIASDSAVSQQARSHLIREELTQVLGLANDSYAYTDSIFYQAWSTVTEFSDIDRAIIGVLYRDDVTPGMDRDDLLAVLSSSLCAATGTGE